MVSKSPPLWPTTNHLVPVLRVGCCLSGLWLCGLLASGELFLWNRDRDVLKTATAVPEVAQMIATIQGAHGPFKGDSCFTDDTILSFPLASPLAATVTVLRVFFFFEQGILYDWRCRCLEMGRVCCLWLSPAWSSSGSVRIPGICQVFGTGRSGDAGLTSFLLMTQRCPVPKTKKHASQPHSSSQRYDWLFTLLLGVFTPSGTVSLLMFLRSWTTPVHPPLFSHLGKSLSSHS